MKSGFLVVAGIILLAGQVFGADDALLKSQKDKVSYAIGVFSGNGLKQQSIDVDPDIMARGIKDSLSESKTLLTDQEMREVMSAFQKDMAIKQAEKRSALAEKNKKEGETFLAENKAKEGIKTLPSGLQYKVIKEGTGKSPKATDEVVAHYRGTRIDGIEFDSSYKRNDPATFKLDQVIKGWAEALVLMKEGAKWQLFIPADLAYGESGLQTIIEPNAVLIFDVELISVNQKKDESNPEKPMAKPLKPTAKSPAPASKPSKPAAGK
jgi:FKBP-type peptidyl-prolyl cis-trans isomerase FklB